MGMRRTNHANGFLGSILSAALALLLSSCMAEPVLTSKGDGLAQGIRHKAPIVNNLSVSADGRRVLTGSFDAFFLWDLQQGKLLQTFTHGKGYMGDTTVVAFAPDGTTFASGGKGIKLWDAATRLQTKVVGEGRTTGLSFSADGKLLLATEYLDRMVLWETASGRMVRAFPWPGVSSSAISPDGRYALSGDRKGWMILWDCATGAELKRVKADHGPTFPPLAEIRSVAFSQDGRRALSGGYDKVAKLWDLPACTEVKTFKGHTGFGGVNAVAFSPDSQFAVTGQAVQLGPSLGTDGQRHLRPYRFLRRGGCLRPRWQNHRLRRRRLHADLECRHR